MDKKEFSLPTHGKEIVLSPEHRLAFLPTAKAVAPPDDRLDSWKAIANHLGREVRTVQLWEKLEGMPVHRHFHRKLGSVFAYRSEVDAWRKSTSRPPDSVPSDLPEGLIPFGAEQRRKKVVIAVLPFERLGGAREQDCFNEGVTVEIITALGNLAAEGLGVISRASVILYKESPRRAERLGKELNVGYILEGTTQIDMGRIRVNVALVDVRDRTTLWSKSYTSSFENSLQLQSRVASQIAHHIGRTLLFSATPARALSPVGRSASRDAYFMGRYFWNQRTEHALRKAVGIFEAVIRENPEFALAHSGLADCLTLLSYYEIAPPAEMMPVARRAALKAVALDPYSAEARTSLADVLFHFDGDWTRADQEYQAAIQCNPEYGLSYHWYANLLAAQGKHEAAYVAIMRALDLDPVSAITNAWAGVISHFGRRYHEAISHYRRALELNPDFVWARMFMAQTLEQMGQMAEALDEFKATVLLSGGSTYAKAMLAHAQAASGDKSAALQTLNDLNGERGQKPAPSYDIAAVYATLGDSRKTITWLDRAFAERNMKLFTLAEDPRFDPVRNLPQIKHLISRVGVKSTAPRHIASKS